MPGYLAGSIYRWQKETPNVILAWRTPLGRFSYTTSWELGLARIQRIGAKNIVEGELEQLLDVITRNRAAILRGLKKGKKWHCNKTLVWKIKFERTRYIE
jgi:hypothetical protein